MNRHSRSRFTDEESQEQGGMNPSEASYYTEDDQQTRSTYSGAGPQNRSSFSRITEYGQDNDETIDDTYDSRRRSRSRTRSRSRDYPSRNTADEVTTIQDDDETPGGDRSYSRQDDETDPVRGRSYSGDETEATSKKYEDNNYSYERSAINDAQSVAYTAYTMNLETGQTIVDDLRNVGVTVLSLESLSTAAMIDYMDAVTTMRLGNETDEKCMLYTDRMGRVFNVIISGGAEGLSLTWITIESSFSGWLAIAIIPFTIREIASCTASNYATSSLAIPPLALLIFFGLVLSSETSHAWLTMSIMVRGTNSVGSHVWRSGSLADYPRVILLFFLAVASTAPTSTSPVGETFGLVGAILGAFILLCNLGSRAWKKLEIGYVDSNSPLSHLAVISTAFISGILFPYIALHNVHGGSDESDREAAVEKIMFHPNGKRARQNVTVAACTVAALFILSDIKAVQEALGFNFVHGGAVNLTVGIWWLSGTIASLWMCNRLDTSKSKKIQPFLKKDETSPVGYIVPSIPNIVIHPNLSTGKMIFPFLAYGSDIICVVAVLGLASFIMWTGIKTI